MGLPDDALTRLAAAGASTPARDVVDQMLAAGSGGKARVVAVMVGSLDGRASIDGRSGGLGNPADRALFRELRGRADVVLVGSRTIAVEGYGNLVDAESVDRRIARGQAAHPLVATIARTAVPLEANLFQSPEVPVVVFTEQAGLELDGVAAAVRLEVAPAGTLTPRHVIEQLAGGGAELIICEGGPTLLAELVSAGLVDDLVLTLAPTLVGAAGASLLGDAPLNAPRPMRLVTAHQAGDHLFLHYRTAEGAA